MRKWNAADARNFIPMDLKKSDGRIDIHDKGRRRFTRLFIRIASARSAKILVVSNAAETRADIHSTIKIGRRIHVS